MLQPTRNKELISIIKSGLVGAFAFTGICFILSIASGFTYWWMAWLLYIFFLSTAFPKTVFFVMGSIGFILGLLLRRRFPIIQRGVLPLVIALIMLVVSLGWRGLLIHKIWMETELPPLNLKLADCTNDVMNIHLKIPKGHAYQLDLNTPRMRVLPGGEWASPYKFSGHLRISSNGSLTADLPIGSDKARLTPSGYVLTGIDSIQANKTYDFEISFEPSPPPGSSIWLYCLVSVRDQ